MRYNTFVGRPLDDPRKARPDFCYTSHTMSPKHHVIYVPGLNDQRKGYELLIDRWNIYGIVPHVHRVGWHDEEKDFKPKLIKLVGEVDKYLDQGHTVSLVGGSAGGSAVLNALLEQNNITAVVNLCGRLRQDENVFPSLELAAQRSPSFKDSVLTFERREPSMTADQRSKVLNLIPLWDEIVPKGTVSLSGATNKTLPSVEHMLSGFLGLTLFSPMIMRFIKEKAMKEN